MSREIFNFVKIYLIFYLVIFLKKCIQIVIKVYTFFSLCGIIYYTFKFSIDATSEFLSDFYNALKDNILILNITIQKEW